MFDMNEIIIVTQTFLAQKICKWTELYQEYTLVNNVQPENFVRRKVSPISPPALIGESFSHDFFLSHVNDYNEDMATFITYMYM